MTLKVQHVYKVTFQLHDILIYQISFQISALDPCFLPFHSKNKRLGAEEETVVVGPDYHLILKH